MPLSRHGGCADHLVVSAELPHDAAREQHCSLGLDDEDVLELWVLQKEASGDVGTLFFLFEQIDFKNLFILLLDNIIFSEKFVNKSKPFGFL